MQVIKDGRTLLRFSQTYILFYSLTVTAHASLLPLELVAVISQLPGARAVTTPVQSTSATAGSLLVQLTRRSSA